MENTNKHSKNLILSAFFLALAYVLPNFTGNIPQIGSMLLPMHLPVLLAGFLCGGPWGALVGAVAPLMRSLLTGMPPMFIAISMTFELATYGLLAGVLYRRLPKRIGGIYASLLVSMVAGRVVWGIAQVVISMARATTFTFSAFIAGAVTGAIPGIILQLVLIPILVLSLQRAKVLAPTRA